MDLKEVSAGVDQDNHWYYQSKKIPLMNFIGKIVLTKKVNAVFDIGSGSGFFSNEIAKEFGAQFERVYQCDTGYTDQEVESTRNQKIVRTKTLPPKITNAVIVMMDVLEHIENDKEFLKDVFARCEGDNNYFFITVPAFKSIWSGHDVYLGHYRRYTTGMLKELLAGNQVQSIGYIYGSLFPIAYLKRKMSGNKVESSMKPTHPVLNSILRRYYSLENRIFQNNLFGLTCLATGRITAHS
jgi:hypothetical protein